MYQPLKLTNNSDVVGSLPALLGFVPTNSFVVILLNEDSFVRCVLRGDIDVNPDSAANLTTICGPAFQNVDAVIMVAICGESLDAQAHAVLDAVRTSMRRAGIGIRGRILARDTTQPGRWTDLDTGDTGPVYPYTDSLLSAQAVHRGHYIAKTRNQIVAEFEATTNPVPVISDNPDDIVIDTLEELAAASASNTAGSPSLATRAGIVITQNVQLRDAALLLGMEHPAHTAALWTTIANQLTGEARLQALTIAAAHFYMASDAIRAGIALEVADEDATAAAMDYPNLAGLLSTALQAGCSPDDIRGVMLRLLGDRG